MPAPGDAPSAPRVEKVMPADVFRLMYAGCGTNYRRPWCVDVRAGKEFKKSHLAHAFNIALSKNGKILADYSKHSYKTVWSQQCWWDKDVVIYGGATLKDDNPVMAFLLAEGKVKTVYVLIGGFTSFEAKYGFLCTGSVRGEPKNYPSEILPGFLFLGTWEHAENKELLKELKVKSVVTIHNAPENLEVAKGVKQLPITLADVESENILPHFSASFAWMEAAREARHRVLVHCGAGVSRSATLVIAYLLRRHGLSLPAALAFCQRQRAVVQPNDGFMRALADFEREVQRAGGPFVELGLELQAVVTTAAAVAAEYGDKKGKSFGLVEDSYMDAVELDAPSVAQPTPVAAIPAAAAIAAPAPAPAQKPAPKIMVYKGAAVVDTIHVKADKKCTFGSHPACNMQLSHLSISRQHATIAADADCALTLEDLGSTHGTKLNGKRIEPNVKLPLPPGSKVSFGASTRLYVVVDDVPAPVHDCTKGSGWDNGAGRKHERWEDGRDEGARRRSRSREHDRGERGDRDGGERGRGGRRDDYRHRDDSRWRDDRRYEDSRRRSRSPSRAYRR